MTFSITNLKLLIHKQDTTTKSTAAYYTNKLFLSRKRFWSLDRLFVDEWVGFRLGVFYCTIYTTTFPCLFMRRRFKVIFTPQTICYDFICGFFNV